jgi:hypothetical protein
VPSTLEHRHRLVLTADAVIRPQSIVFGQDNVIVGSEHDERRYFDRPDASVAKRMQLAALWTSTLTGHDKESD